MKSNFLSTNFWMALLIFVGAMFSISGEVTQQAAGLLIGVVAFAGAAREALKSAKFIGWRKFLDANVWNYFTAALVAGVPTLEPILPAIKKIIDAIAIKDWGAVLTATISAGTIVWYTIIKPKLDAKETAQVGA